MSEPLLTLCVIACNEEATLERCLLSARELVDETVVLDTGSADGTRSIAARLGARVYHEPWQDDFSAARNEALEQVRTPWVLVMDADEEIAEGDARALRETLRASVKEGPDAFTVRIDNVMDGGGISPFLAVRLFRNRPEIRYRGRIHEEVTSSMAELQGGPVQPQPTSLVLTHDGYAAERRQGGDKRQRNLRLLRRALKTDPRRALLEFALAREQFIVSGERIFPGTGFRDALAALERAREAAEQESSPLHLATSITATLAAAMTADLRPQDGLKLLAAFRQRPEIETLHADDAGAILIGFTEARALLAAAGEDRELLEEAVARFEELSGRRPRTGFTDADARMCGVFAIERRAEALGRCGRFDEALSLLDQATEDHPSYAGPWIRRAEVELLRGRAPEGLRAYYDGLKADDHDPEAWLGVGQLLNVVGEPDQALECITSALALVPGWGQALLSKAVVRFLQDEPEEVLAEQSTLREMSPEADTACLVAEVLSGAPVTGLRDAPGQVIERGLLTITFGLKLGRRPDLLARLNHPELDGGIGTGATAPVPEAETIR
ncbi:MAG: glycosyltransferase [bacterium]|nr:glycosyltransferase [bacterium]